MEADFVFVHGFTQTPASWDPVLTAMQQEVGEDDAGVRLFIVPRTVVAGDFRDTAAALGVARAAYIGYSQGGRLALQLALDRPDVFLTGDIALRRAIQRVYGFDHVPTEDELIELSDRWRPYRSLAVSYLFASEYDG